MAYIKCSAGGSSLSETTLWENPAASSGFSAQVVNFTNSQSMANYDYLKFKWRYSTTNAGTGNFAVIVKVTDFRTFTTDQQHPRLVLGGWNSTSNFNSGRAVRYNSDTSVYFYTGVKMGATETNPAWIIPTEIIGLK